MIPVRENSDVVIIYPDNYRNMGMDQYLLIPFLVGWTSIYQLFWCELQGYKVLTHCHMCCFPSSTEPWKPAQPQLSWRLPRQVGLESRDAELLRVLATVLDAGAAAAAQLAEDLFAWGDVRTEESRNMEEFRTNPPFTRIFFLFFLWWKSHFFPTSIDCDGLLNQNGGVGRCVST